MRVRLSFAVEKRIEVFYMKQFEKWRSLCATGLVLGLILSILLFVKKEYIFMFVALILVFIFTFAFFGFWAALKLSLIHI